MISVLLAVIFISGAVLYWYYCTLLFYLKVILIVIILIFAVAAIAWVSHRHHKHGAALLEETAFMTLDNMQQDYCEGIPMERTLSRCEFPFSVHDGHSGSTCPNVEDQKVTFGICAGPKSPEGL